MTITILDAPVTYIEANLACDSFRWSWALFLFFFFFLQWQLLVAKIEAPDPKPLNLDAYVGAPSGLPEHCDQGLRAVLAFPGENCRAGGGGGADRKMWR